MPETADPLVDRSTPGSTPLSSAVAATTRKITEVPRAVRDASTSSLFAAARAAGSDRARRPILHEIVLINASVARSIAHRYARRGIELDDLEQTAYLALVRAVSRFDATRGHDFLAFAVPSVDGEIKRHFRDHGWTVRFPRRLQEVQRLIDRELDLAPETTSAALVDELAHRLAIPPSDIAAALAARAQLPPTSLDAPNVSDVEGRPVTAWAILNGGASAAEARAVLTPVLRGCRHGTGRCCGCGTPRNAPSRRSPRSSGSPRPRSRGSSPGSTSSLRDQVAGGAPTRVPPTSEVQVGLQTRWPRRV